MYSPVQHQAPILHLALKSGLFSRSLPQFLRVSLFAPLVPLIMLRLFQ